MANAWAVEAKVIASTLAAANIGIVIAFLNDVEGHSDLLGSLPGWAQASTLIVIPTVTTFLAGYRAKHTPRTNV